MRYQLEIRHNGLNKYRLVSGTDKYVVEEKARAQLATWNAQWARHTEAEARRSEKEKKADRREQMRQEAIALTIDAQNIQNELEHILLRTLSVHDAVEWDNLKNHEQFSDPCPSAPAYSKLPIEPNPKAIQYQPQFDLLDWIMSSREQRKINQARTTFQEDHQKWGNERDHVLRQHADVKADYERRLAEWDSRRSIYEKRRVEGNVAVDALAHRYSNCDPDAIVEYCDLILSQSDYPEFMPKEWQVEYLTTSSIIVVDYQIPSVQDMPTLKEVRYFVSKNCLEHIHLREGTVNKVYDKVIYQVCLRTIHELFEADVAGALKSIVFNGWVHYKDKATGNDTRACIMSVEASKERFLQINLAAVDPKECFRSLKGVGSTQLHGMAPIAPVLQLNRTDSRFVASVDVASHLDEGTNLAAIGWEEFEHLIRQVFEQEFSASGGEVKVTQASRDGGVDAVAFDPDPIRGGKIVIQAKRYTNTVDVSAVRDLYGTVMNEGATKGILVTTSDFGPDAYRFIKDKPLTLLNGSNLLHLLSKHGHRARIDLKEAKLLGIGLRR